MAVKTYQKAERIQLTEHFNSREFRCGLGRPSNCTTTLIDSDLVAGLEKIHKRCRALRSGNVTITITSGYRCPEYNRSIDGATGSYHSRGMAADIVVAGFKPREIAGIAESLGFKGIGLYETDKDGHFVHVDTRTYKSFWYGQAQTPRSTFGGMSAVSPASPGTSTTTGSSYTLRQFITDVQQACGATVDGVAGPDTLAHTVTVSASTNISHPVVLAVQKRLASLGYAQVGTADGVAGSKFTAALKDFQAKAGCKYQDGEATKGAETWRKLLGMS